MPNIIKSSQYNVVASAIAFHLKSSDSVPVSQDTNRLSFGLDEAKREILEEAIEKSKKMVEAAQAFSMNHIKESRAQMEDESAKLRSRSREEGYQQGFAEGIDAAVAEGYQEGYAEGIRKAEEAQRQILDEMVMMLNTIEEEKKDILQSFSEDVEKLALTIAKKVIKSEVRMHDETMEAIILRATEEYRNQAWVNITVSKNRAAIFTKADNRLLFSLQQVSEHVKIVESPQMEDDDCRIEMPDRIIDVGVNTQLDKIEDELAL